MKYIVTQEIKSETQIVWCFYFQDFLFLAAWSALTFSLRDYVQKDLQIPYILFSVVIGILLMIRSNGNPKRRFYQSIMLYLLRPKGVFRYYEEQENEAERNRTYQEGDTDPFL